jgi:hypothetical protein
MDADFSTYPGRVRFGAVTRLSFKRNICLLLTCLHVFHKRLNKLYKTEKCMAAQV